MCYLLLFQLQTMLSMDEKAIINNTQEFKQQIIQLLESLHSHTSKGKIFSLAGHRGTVGLVVCINSGGRSIESRVGHISFDD